MKVLILCSLLVLAVCGSQNNLYMWSSSHISGADVQNLNTIYSSDISTLLRSVAGEENTKFSTHFSGSPLLTVLFISDNSVTEFKQLQDLQKSFDTASFPYGYFTDSALSTVSSFIKETENVFVVGDSFEKVTSGSLAEALEFAAAAENQSLVVVDGRGNTIRMNEALTSFNSLLQVVDSTAVFMDLSVNEAANVNLPKSRKAYSGMKQALEYGEAAPFNTRFPSYIIEGLLIAFMLAFIAAVGVFCACTLQTPERFETPRKKDI